MAHYSFFLVVVVVVVALIVGPTWASVQCLDPSGNPVDWWTAYKFPKLSESSNETFVSGLGYAYFDANTIGEGFHIMDHGLDSQSANPVYNTLQQLYSSSSSAAYIMYNDEDPDNNNHENYGHSKGDVLFDQNSGFWLVHSVPRWPPHQDQSYTYPPDECDFGQTFLCMSLPASAFNSVAGMFIYNKIYVYDHYLPSWAASAAPQMSQVVNGQFRTDSATTTAQLKTLAGNVFHAFGKTMSWGQDLYEDLVAQSLGTSLLVESWQDGSESDKMPSYCTPNYSYDVMNINDIRFGNTLSFPESKDHAKWAVAVSKPGWTCVGDINRQYSQRKRGGGTVCLFDNQFYTNYNNTVGGYSSC